MIKSQLSLDKRALKLSTNIQCSILSLARVELFIFVHKPLSSISTLSDGKILVLTLGNLSFVIVSRKTFESNATRAFFR